MSISKSNRRLSPSEFIEDTKQKIIDAICDSTPAVLRQVRAEAEGLATVEKLLNQLLEAEEISSQNDVLRRSNLQKIERIRQAKNPAVIAYARERGWLPQVLSTDAIQIINANASITEGYMDADICPWKFD